MKVNDICVVTSSDCCGGHSVGTLVHIVEVIEPELAFDKIKLYECKPLKNHTINTCLWHCDKCLVIIDKESI